MENEGELEDADKENHRREYLSGHGGNMHPESRSSRELELES